MSKKQTVKRVLLTALQEKNVLIKDDELGMLDQTGAAHGVQVQIRYDGKVLWVNSGARCRLRICNIRGPITLEDPGNQVKKHK